MCREAGRAAPVLGEVFPLHSWRIDIFARNANRTSELVSDLPTQSDDGMTRGFLLTHPVRLEARGVLGRFR